MNGNDRILRLEWRINSVEWLCPLTWHCLTITRSNIAMISFIIVFLTDNDKRYFIGNIIVPMLTNNYGIINYRFSNFATIVVQNFTNIYLCMLKNNIPFFEIDDFKHLRINLNNYVIYVIQSNTWIYSGSLIAVTPVSNRTVVTNRMHLVFASDDNKVNWINALVWININILCKNSKNYKYEK